MTSVRGSDWISRRLRLAVGQRLLLGLAPSLLAIVLVVALGYYGEVGREAPEYVVAGAALLALLSLALTWWNTRYLVRRLRGLGRHAGSPNGDDAAVDDLDRIEREVARLARELKTATHARDVDHEQLERKLHDQATVLAATLRGLTAQVDEVRLPLHILLDARFGELNENQEELLVSAREGADQIDAAVRRLSLMADADRDALTTRLEPVALNEVIRAVLPMVRASAERRNAQVNVTLEPALPRVWANRAAIAEAIALIATRAAEQLDSGQHVEVETLSRSDASTVRITPVSASLWDDTLVIVAMRSLHLQGITQVTSGQSCTLSFPRVLAAEKAKF